MREIKMEERDIAQLSEYLDGLITGTETGKFVWAQVNPTTYLWATPAARLTLQQVETLVTTPSKTSSGISMPVLSQVQHYVLQGGPTTAQAGQPLLLNGKDSNLLNEKL